MADPLLSIGATGDNVALLHTTLQQQGFSIPAAEITQKTFGSGTQQAVQQFQQKNGLPVTGSVDAQTAAKLAGAVSAAPPATPVVSAALKTSTAVATPAASAAAPAQPAIPIVITPPTATAPPASVHGTLSFDNGLTAGGVTVRLYRIGFGGRDVKLGETKTGTDGSYEISYPAVGAGLNLQLRALNAAGGEVPISATRYNVGIAEVFNLVVPASIQPLPSEYQRLSADVERSIGSIAQLGVAQENATRQDLTLLTKSINWDARLTALAATAAQQASATGLGQDVLYGLFRAGLPSDPALLAQVPVATVQKALSKSSQAGVVSLNADQIAAAATAFSAFAQKTQPTLSAAAGVSTYGDLLVPVLTDPTQRKAFTSLYFSQPEAGADFWAQAAALNLPAPALDALKTQGKFLHLTLNNVALAQKLQQDIGSIANLSQLADKDYHDPATWTTVLTGLPSANTDAGLQKLIPAIYQGNSTQERLAAYAGDMARKVRLSFPTHVAARLIEKNALTLPAGTGPNVTAFLRAAASQGFELGRTPLNAFINRAGKSVPALDKAHADSLKSLHRLFQVTPSNESLQALLTHGYSSAHQIASYTEAQFLNKHATDFPSLAEASLVYRKAQQITTVTFNAFTMAKQMDAAPPVYAVPSSSSDKQSAKNALIQQFPSMTNLFGSLDFCQCQECRSVLSPAAYFVDLLEYLRQSTVNSNGNTPLDVLIGNPPGDTPTPTHLTVPGRRPDLGALALTCENTNTALPYIDLVNEILEYTVANAKLDQGAAYDTGSATTADLIAEPQHTLPQVYNVTLKQSVYPHNLPFDLWIETVRGFLNYFNTPLPQVLDALRPVDALELFGPPSSPGWYRAQIFSEALGLSPAEYQVLTVTAPGSVAPSVSNWFQLYGYADELTAMNGKPDPVNIGQYLIPPLKVAQNLSQRLGVSYQEMADLVGTGFLNPALYALIFQFQRFGIDMDDAFSYTGQPGSIQPMPSAQSAAFQAQLAAITARYQKNIPGFDAGKWLSGVLPANYSKKVLVLHDPDSGCNFSGTSLQYADGSPATQQDFLKLSLLVRLWKKTGWSLDEIDRALQLFFPTAGLPAWTDANFATAFSNAMKTALAYLAHLDDLNTRLAPSLGRSALLPLWGNLATQGVAPLYAQLFLTPGVVNSDWAFDDPNGVFPYTGADTLALHQDTVQGVLGLSAAEVAAILSDAGVAAGASFNLDNLSLCYRYSLLARCLQLPVTDLIALKALTNLNPFPTPSNAPLLKLVDDLLFNQTLEFVRQVGVVQNSGFSVADLQYLLRQQVDPLGPYQQDPATLVAQMQALATGLQKIQSQNAVPPNLSGLPDSQIDQTLSALFPAALLKSLFTLLTNAQTVTATQGGVAAANAIDPQTFAQETALSFAYDAVTQIQSVSYIGLLTDWKKTQLALINTTPLFANLLSGLQQQGQTVFKQRVADILGVWASLIQYQAVRHQANKINDALLVIADPAISLSYDQTDSLQWVAYRGVLTGAAKNALLAIDNSTDLAALLNDLQQQSNAAYTALTGNLLGMLCSAQAFSASQSGVAAANALDPSLFLAWPQVQLSYDAVGQTQTLVYQGVLTSALAATLTAAAPTSTVLPPLLANVRNQATQLFQTLAGNYLTVTVVDVDNYSAPFQGLSIAGMQKQVKAQLVTTFLPLQTAKLSQQLILQTLSANFAADPSLTGVLATDTAFLSDPSNPGNALIGAFLATAQPGVSATYYASTEMSGAPLATAAAAMVDTADPSNPNAGKEGTGSAHFEGYLQVATDGPYRFFAELGNQQATIAFKLDTPDSSGPFASPLAATQDNQEFSQYVQLKGGVAYHFSVDLTKLGANGASLLVQGENVPKGPLSQIQLYPQQTFAGFVRARLLLAKVLQILQTTGIGEREISYLIANSAQFANLKLSSLPTQASDDSLTKAHGLFLQFLMLADYADLRKGPAGGTDGLIDVFKNVGVPYQEAINSNSSNLDPSAPWTCLANLTRRDVPTVRALATYFGLISVNGAAQTVTAIDDFANNKGLRRLWQALQVQQLLGIPVAALTAATNIVALAPPATPTPDQIAGDFKNAVMALYTADAWRPVAQSVFDKLRQKKRDALVAYLLNTMHFDNENQLFEYFLVDPGMEPVMHTSRVRLALSSVQTFIQRCLLNLENGNAAPQSNVAPSALDADWWEWMKRYRVWEANREIFLFPENWMEPELRLDKTDLFQTLEGTLLQGDVTSDLADSAFLAYLQGLDAIARLDIVASYLDQDLTNPDISTLHVLGRTYGKPRKYFYRNFSCGSWSEWKAVKPDIDGNHIVLAMWRGRLNVFWLTFISKVQAPPKPAPSSDTTAAASMPLVGLTDGIYDAFTSQAQLHVQLNWSEYYQGKWSDRLCSDVNRIDAENPFNVPGNFNVDTGIYVHVTVDLDGSGNEGAVCIHLDLVNSDDAHASGYAFRVTSKNSEPDFGSKHWQAASRQPYRFNGVDASLYTGNGTLTVAYESDIGQQEIQETVVGVLNGVADYSLLACGNPVVPPLLDKTDPRYQAAGSLVSPFFFKDKAGGINNGELTFFAQPTLTEQTITTWEGWALAPNRPVQGIIDGSLIDHIDVIAQVPITGIPLPSPDPSTSLFTTNILADWVTHPATVVSFGGTLVGQNGLVKSLNPQIAVSLDAASVNSVTAATTSQAGLARQLATQGIAVVGAQGLNAANLQLTTNVALANSALP
ncbi:MAG: neuraminidase-like domain-containing protein [Burkholderiaceae bacterium]|nr:neuraminidase-like domain-containing protein [Burkholderiaceae bacterium]